MKQEGESWIIEPEDMSRVKFGPGCKDTHEFGVSLSGEDRKAKVETRFTLVCDLEACPLTRVFDLMRQPVMNAARTTLRKQFSEYDSLDKAAQEPWTAVIAAKGFGVGIGGDPVSQIKQVVSRTTSGDAILQMQEVLARAYASKMGISLEEAYQRFTLG